MTLAPKAGMENGEKLGGAEELHKLLLNTHSSQQKSF